jgi:hypothetical protein
MVHEAIDQSYCTVRSCVWQHGVDSRAMSIETLASHVGSTTTSSTTNGARLVDSHLLRA